MYLWIIRNKKSLIFSAVSVILMVILCQTSNAKEKDVKPAVRIELLSGGTKTLSSPLRFSGQFKTENFIISYLPIEKIESLVLSENQQGNKNYILKLLGVDKPIRGSLTNNAEITGLGDWGKESIAIGKIKSMHIINAADSKPFEPKSKWRCIFTNSEQVIVQLSMGSDFSGQLDNASLDLALQKVAKLSRNGGLWTVISNDGFSLEGWQPKRKSLSANSIFGGLELSWSKISKLFNESISAGNLKSKHNVSHKPDWEAVVGGRFVLPVSEVRTGSRAKINNELDIKSLNWQFIDSVSPKPTGLELRFINKKSWMLQGTLSVTIPIGKLETSCGNITKMVRLQPPPKNRVPSDYSKKITGSITTVSGTEYPVATPSLTGGNRAESRDYFGYNLFIIQAAPVEFWVESEKLLSYILTVKNKKLVSDNPILMQHGPIGGFTALTFVNPAGNFELPLSKLSKYVPNISISKKSKVLPAKYRVTVRSIKGNEFTASVATIEFARYPKYGWSGYYYTSDYPFQWHRNSELLFKKESGERIDVQFEKLRKIEITGQYTLARHATLTNTTGSMIKGLIYPGDVAKSHGVSTWDPYNEGLLCKNTNAMYFFVRFKEVKSIEIIHVPGK
jgi:hypothetical protein